MMRKHLLALALLGAAAPVMAQGKPAAPAAAKSKLEVINQGELRLDGKITALLGTGVWQVEAQSWTSPRRVTTEFDEPKNKGVKVGASAYLHPRGEEDKVPLKEVKLGARVAIIGKNGPDGSLIAREVILLEGYGSRKTVGQVSTNQFTSVLVDQSRAARDNGDLSKAITLIDRAIATARGMGDTSGEALATTDKGTLHLDMEQYDAAMTAYRRVEVLGRELGNPLVKTVALRNIGSVLLKQGKLDEGIESLKQADAASTETNPAAQLSVLSRLSSAYLASGRLIEAVAVMERIHPLEQAQGSDADAGETLLMIAALQAPEKPNEAREALTASQERIQRARDEKSKAKLLGAAALVRWRLGDKEEGRTGFTEAAQLLEGAGDASGAKRWNVMAQNLEGAGDEWQSFWMAANGLQSGTNKGNAAPPAEAPPVDAPPAEVPPMEEPPADVPPADTPPADPPPVDVPPADTPPADPPPAEAPPV